MHTMPTTALLGKRLSTIASKIVTKLSPKLNKKRAVKSLLTPKRIQSKWPARVKQFNTPTRYGNVKTYQYGEGKSVWLVHGWSNSAFSFWPLMQSLAERGYACTTFDFPAHGLSKGQQTSLPQMIKAFEDVSDVLLDPSMIIAHSTGASIVANSCFFERFNRDLLLVSPVLNSYSLMNKIAKNTGIEQQLFDEVIHDLFKKEKLFLPDLNVSQKLASYYGELTIIHDKQDDISPFSQSEKLSLKSEIPLISTNNLGHHKILKSKSIVKVIESKNCLAT